MAFRRRDVSQAFRNNRQLQQFMLTNVTPTGRVLGTGSYGSVEEVKYGHLVCAGKKLHETLIDDGNEGVANIVRKYEQECQLMSGLRHPNITQFLGLCFLPGTRLPLLVMERLETSLDDLLEHMPGLPLSLKCSVLEDVVSGLIYLHDRPAPIIHRDLTANNVLLTSSLVAKITDMGNSRIIDMRPGQLARTLSRLPGTLVYMPPEALNETHRYGPSLDIFSLGHLILYTATQVFPGDLLSGTFPDPDNPERALARTEVERRGEYMEILEGDFGYRHPALVQLVRQCLHNAPERRPTTNDVLGRLQRLKVEVEGVYGGSLVKLDIGRVLLAKEIKKKDKKIEELREVEERFEVAQERTDQLAGELEISQERQEQLRLDHVRQLQQKDRDMEMKDRQLQQKDRDMEQLQLDHVRQLQQKDRDMEVQLQQKDRDMEMKDRQFQQLRREMESLRVEMEGREARLREELQSKETENNRLMEELRRCWESPQEGARQVLRLPVQIDWRYGPDMPFEMSGFIQSVVVQGTVYVGGGITTRDENKRVVLEYDTSSGKWGKLPPYITRYFAMTVINNHLVLVGGDDESRLGVWRTDSKKWTHPYPNMPTVRGSPSAVTYKEWLIVVGGFDSEANSLSSVDIMNTNSKQWHTAAPAPTTWHSMNTAVVGDICYFMGGFVGDGAGSATDVVYSVSLPALISQVNSKHSAEKGQQIWKNISGLGLYGSTPLSLSGSLLALGGKGIKDRKAVTAIHHYRPETGEWVKVGDLPSPRYFYTCVRMTNGQVLVAGGFDDKEQLKTTELASFK